MGKQMIKAVEALEKIAVKMAAEHMSVQQLDELHKKSGYAFPAASGCIIDVIQEDVES